MTDKQTENSTDNQSPSQATQEQLSEYVSLPPRQEQSASHDRTMHDGGSTHTSPEDCATEGTVAFDGDLVAQGEKIARLGKCHSCGRKFERVYYHSHDQCYEPEVMNVSCRSD